jgi:hypothetical protein
MEKQMALSIYDVDEKPSSQRNYNNVTVARALGGKRLNKTIYASGRIVPYDNAYKYKFFNIQIESLEELCQLVQLLLARPYSCIIRGTCIDEDKVPQRRLLNDDPVTKDPATIIEQEQNWFALDVDGYGTFTGDLRRDTQSVLLALGLDGVECFAIPSASYTIKPGIHIRLFFWNDEKVSCLSLKNYFKEHKGIVDLALFNPIQPIFIARPTFVGLDDPCKKQIVWLTGQEITTSIANTVSVHRQTGGAIQKSTKAEAVGYFRKMLRLLPDVSENRHDWLRDHSYYLGRCIWQELLDEDEIIEQIVDMCQYFWRGNSKNDINTINHAIKRGKLDMERSDEF